MPDYDGNEKRDNKGIHCMGVFERSFVRFTCIMDIAGKACIYEVICMQSLGSR